MKLRLTQELVRRISNENMPTGFDPKTGKLLFGRNESGKAFIVFDADQKSPVGFGLKIAGKKTFILQRRAGARVVKATVCNCSDMSIEQAREKAQKMAQEIVATGANPNALAKKRIQALPTLGKILDDYIEHLKTRTQKPAGDSSIKVMKRGRARFEEWGWTKRLIKDLSTKEVREKFSQEFQRIPTSTEQHFRWASTAIKWAMAEEIEDADSAGRPRSITGNPFSTLVRNKMYRTREQLERDRNENFARNPMSPTLTLGPFLEAAWSKRNTNNNQTGVEFLICMLLWGCRKGEHAPLQWGERLTADQRKTTSHVWLGDGEWGPYIFFYKTKNGRDLRLPLAPMGRTLLERRQAAAAEQAAEKGFGKAASRRFVFPAKSRFSKSGHYAAPGDLIGRIREEVGIERLAPHDFRRTFGAICTSIDVPEGIKKRFLNHADGDVTALYTQAEWILLRQWMERIEQAIISKAPNIYNSLKPVDWPPLAAPEPHVCKPPKPRSGRPRKIREEAETLDALEGGAGLSSSR